MTWGEWVAVAVLAFVVVTLVRLAVALRDS